MGFINYRGGQKQDNFDTLSKKAKEAERVEQIAAGSQKRRQNAADYFGVSKYALSDNKEVLLHLLTDYKELLQIHNKLISQNPIAESFDDKQLIKDLWLWSISDILHNTNLTSMQKKNATQLLLQAFGVQNTTTAEQHYIFVERNDAYRQYLNNCFGLDGIAVPQLWVWIQHLGNQELPGVGRHNNTRMSTAVFFMQKYMDFLMLLSFYLSQLFPDKGCGKNTRQKILSKIEMITAYVNSLDHSDIDFSVLVNPLYANPNDFRADYSGYDMPKNQSEDLKQSFGAMKNSFDKVSRVENLIHLLDMCSDNESTVLANNYKHIVSMI